RHDGKARRFPRGACQETEAAAAARNFSSVLRFALDAHAAPVATPFFTVNWMIAVVQRDAKIKGSRRDASAFALRAKGAKPIRTAPAAMPRNSGRPNNEFDVAKSQRRSILVAAEP